MSKTSKKSKKHPKHHAPKHSATAHKTPTAAAATKHKPKKAVHAAKRPLAVANAAPTAPAATAAPKPPKPAKRSKSPSAARAKKAAAASAKRAERYGQKKPYSMSKASPENKDTKPIHVIAYEATKLSNILDRRLPELQAAVGETFSPDPAKDKKYAQSVQTALAEHWR